MEIKVSGILREKTSKSGNKYYAIDIQLTDSYTKTVFLEQVELELIQTFLENQRLKNNE